MNKIIYYTATLLVGGFLGWIIFAPSSDSKPNNESVAAAPNALIYTCSMHPQIKLHKPGKCPICGMDLVPVITKPIAKGMNMDAITLSPEALALAGIKVFKVESSHISKTINLYGTVEVNEQNVQIQSAHVDGRIEKLLINYTGQVVKEGQTLALLYSPELVNAQQELQEAVSIKPTQPNLIAAARNKLKLWKLSDAQIASMEKSLTPMALVPIKANTSGVVTELKVKKGSYVKQGEELMQVSNLSLVWVVLEAYEQDLSLVKVGNKVQFNTQALPGEQFEGTITFIDPLMDASKRTASLRVEVNNTSGKLKPDMYVDASITINVPSNEKNIIIPQSAVLWTGTRSVVYVKDTLQAQPTFTYREVKLGKFLNNDYEVLNGLNIGEEVVSEGTFALDASAQLEGKKSMMNQHPTN